MTWHGAQVVIAGLLGRFYSNAMPTDVSIVVVVFVCLFVSGHAWSWGARRWPLDCKLQRESCVARSSLLCPGCLLLKATTSSVRLMHHMIPSCPAKSSFLSGHR